MKKHNKINRQIVALGNLYSRLKDYKAGCWQPSLKDSVRGYTADNKMKKCLKAIETLEVKLMAVGVDLDKLPFRPKNNLLPKWKA